MKISIESFATRYLTINGQKPVWYDNDKEIFQAIDQGKKIALSRNRKGNPIIIPNSPAS